MSSQDQNPDLSTGPIVRTGLSTKQVALSFKAQLDLVLVDVDHPALIPKRQLSLPNPPGVYPYLGRKWRVQIRIRGKIEHLGYTKSRSLAVVMFNKACKEYYDNLTTWWEIRKAKRHPNNSSRRRKKEPEMSQEEREEDILKQLFGGEG